MGNFAYNPCIISIITEYVLHNLLMCGNSMGIISTYPDIFRTNRCLFELFFLYKISCMPIKKLFWGGSQIVTSLNTINSISTMRSEVWPIYTEQCYHNTNKQICDPPPKVQLSIPLLK